jgi:hypothetical protein
MSSTTPSRPSVSVATSKKKSSPSGGHAARTCATSTEDLAQSTYPGIKRESSSGFNYQALAETSPVNLLASKSKPPVRSHSSNNAELTSHLQQLKNLSKRKTTFNEEDPSNHNERIRLTPSNLKIVCNENGREVSVHSVNTLANAELPVSWKPAVQQAIPPRDSWDHKIEFLLAVIGYAVDLGETSRRQSRHLSSVHTFRQCLAFPDNSVHEWRWSILHSLLHSIDLRWSATVLVSALSISILLDFPCSPSMELALGQYHRSGVFTVWKNVRCSSRRHLSTCLSFDRYVHWSKGSVGQRY